jgi:hypothetical protein
VKEVLRAFMKMMAAKTFEEEGEVQGYENLAGKYCLCGAMS